MLLTSALLFAGFGRTPLPPPPLAFVICVRACSALFPSAFTMGKKEKGQAIVKKRKRSDSDDGAAEKRASGSPNSGAISKPGAATGVWKRVKVKNIQLQETGFFGLEELHIEGDPKNVDWAALINAPTSHVDLSDAERATFESEKILDDGSDIEEAEDTPEENVTVQGTNLVLLVNFLVRPIIWHSLVVLLHILGVLKLRSN